MWDHTAIAADSKLIVSLVVGKRTQAQTRAVVHDTKKRLRPGHLPAIFTDAYEGYESAILEAFGRRYPAPSRSAPGRSRRSVGFPAEYAKFLAVAVPRVISDTGVSHLLMSLTD